MTRFFHGTMTVIVLIVLGITLIGLPASGIRVPFSQIVPKIAFYTAVLGLAIYCRYRGAERFSDAMMIVFWVGLVSDLHVFPMFVAGRSGVPYQDEMLAGFDQALGLEVTDVLALMANYPRAQELLSNIYYTLVYLMTFALLGTTLLGKVQAAKEYVISCALAVAVCFPFFAAFQALGPWTQYGYAASPAQAEFVNVMQALRSEHVFDMDLGYVSGLICFPSFHTILAMLSGLALRTVPYVRWVALAWAALIVFSTLTTGWHYVVDVLAGLAVAAGCVLGTRGFSRVEAKVYTQRAAEPEAQPSLTPCLAV